MSYRVNAEWDDTGWWVVTVPDVPGAITQSHRLDQVPADAAEAIEIQTGRHIEPKSLGVRAAMLSWSACRRFEPAGERVQARRPQVNLRTTGLAS